MVLRMTRMKSYICVRMAVAAVLMTLAPAIALAQDSAVHQAVVDQYCVTCHNTTARTAGLALDEVDVASAADHPDIFEAVVRKLRGGQMPPLNAPQPGDDAREGLVA